MYIFFAVFRSHNVERYGYKANLYSLHSWIGIGAVLLFGQNYVLGAMHFMTEKIPMEMKKVYMPYHVFLGEIAYMACFAAVETGIMQKATFMKCGYSVTEPDYNPAENYTEIPSGCRLGNGIGVIVVPMVFAVFFVLKNWAKPAARDPLLSQAQKNEL
jgi:hypothetical protein